MSAQSLSKKNEALTESELRSVWRSISSELEITGVIKNLGNIFPKVHLENYTNNEIDLICNNSFTKDTIQRKLSKELVVLLQKFLKTTEDLKINFVIRDDPAKDSDQPLGPLFDDATETIKITKDTNSDLKNKQTKSNLSPKFLFENYLMGRHNQLAYAVATAVAAEPGTKYNPVFIYSGVGLGKTHLMQAIGNQILKDRVGLKVIYCTGEAFTNEVIEAIRNGKGSNKSSGTKSMSDIRDKFRKADVLLIDDIQFVIGKEATQAEFFHTFNDLVMNQKQVVVTSDRPPKEFKTLEERVTSRFASGMIIDIQKPDLETRSAILRSRRERDGDIIPNDVIDVIAEKIDTNVRELEGGYIQVLTTAKNAGVIPSIEIALQALGHTGSVNYKKPVNINQIIKAVCDYYSVKKDELKGKDRSKEIVIPRQIAMYLIKEMMDMPYITIGEFLGGRDHTTIMHGVNKVGKEMMREPKHKQDIANLKQTIVLR